MVNRHIEEGWPVSSPGGCRAGKASGPACPASRQIHTASSKTLAVPSQSCAIPIIHSPSRVALASMPGPLVPRCQPDRMLESGGGNPVRGACPHSFPRWRRQPGHRGRALTWKLNCAVEKDRLRKGWETPGVAVRRGGGSRRVGGVEEGSSAIAPHDHPSARRRALPSTVRHRHKMRWSLGSWSFGATVRHRCLALLETAGANPVVECFPGQTSPGWCPQTKAPEDTAIGSRVSIHADVRAVRKQSVYDIHPHEP